MCVVPYWGDTYTDRWKNPNYPVWPSYTSMPVTREEIEALKDEVKEFKKALIITKGYDEKTGQPEREMEEKIALIKKVAKEVGVDLREVFGED